MEIDLILTTEMPLLFILIFLDVTDSVSAPSQAQKDTTNALKLKQIEINQKATVIQTHLTTQKVTDMKAYLDFCKSNGMTDNPRYFEVQQAYAEHLYQSAMTPHTPVVMINLIDDDDDASNCSSSVKLNKRIQSYHQSIVDDEVKRQKLDEGESSSL